MSSDGEALVGLHFLQGPRAVPRPPKLIETPLLREVADQLAAYFAGRLQVFRVPLAPPGTAFQRAVWEGLYAIAYGQTRTYAEHATAIGRPRAFRAVGAANGQNPISIVVPCHRLVGSDGRLTGYGGGLDAKARLLALERGAGIHGP